MLNHYEQKEWVEEHTPDWSEVYNFYPCDRQREQLFRWLAIWKLGGFWISTRFQPLQSFEPLSSRSLVLAEKQRMTPGEFENLHGMEWDNCMPPEALIEIMDHSFAAAPGNWFVERVLDLLIERAGYLDSNFEPDSIQEQFATGSGVVNAAWLSSVLDGICLTDVLLPVNSLDPIQAERISRSGIEYMGNYGFFESGF
jgi:hypothetical protein